MMDTHEEFTKLVEAGADEKLAEAVVKLHSRAQITDTVTKVEFNDFREDVSASFNKVDERFDKVEDRFDKVEKEIADVRTELKSDISDVRIELKSEIVGVKSDLKWMKGIGAAILAAVVIPMLTELL